MSSTLIFDGHLDLAMNAIEWNRDLTRPLSEIRQREIHMDLGNEMVEGRDFERRAGQTYFYRAYDADDVFLNPASPQMNHNISISGGNDKTTYCKLVIKNV